MLAQIYAAVLVVKPSARLVAAATDPAYSGASGSFPVAGRPEVGLAARGTLMDNKDQRSKMRRCYGESAGRR